MAGYDDKCIDEDLPESLGKAGPWKVLLAAAAAKAMIDADGVTIVAYDSDLGTRDPMGTFLTRLGPGQLFNRRGRGLQGSIRVWTSSFLRGARRAKSEGL